ncbi:MAG TPA: phospholipase [Thermoanaerobaculia bacterium]|jgi:predicted esterase|nr:phospholipase [Thermoanaerobaculia bacterium]
MAETHLIETTIHGRYVVRPGSSRHLVGFHGYGQTAEIMMGDLERIPGASEWTLVSVQALNRFYGKNEEVAANWMTRQDREDAIADNILYVQRVMAGFPDRTRLVFAGFSQGVAMAWRAAANIPCDGVISLSGDVPPDVTAPTLPPALLGRGSFENWYSDEKFKKDLSFLAGRSEVTSCVFRGGHEWTDEFRRAAGVFLSRWIPASTA